MDTRISYIARILSSTSSTPQHLSGLKASARAQIVGIAFIAIAFLGTGAPVWSQDDDPLPLELETPEEVAKAPLADSAPNEQNPEVETAAPLPSSLSVDLPTRPDEAKASYRVGRGDLLNIRLLAPARTAPVQVQVSPQGTISFLAAQHVVVEQLTIPEIRKKLEQVLASLELRLPQVSVAPAGLASATYTMLGMVKQNGEFPMQKPTHLLEAIALSGGIVAAGGVSGARLAVDFERSFLIRNEAKVDVDFRSLYMEGDLSENVLLQPGDYVYIASSLKDFVYAFGAVASPGLIPADGRLTVMGTITAAGGYGYDAWRNRILLVRGALSKPEAIVINTQQILKGEATDQKVEPGDIVYVHTKPWAAAERLLDSAVSSYLRGVLSGYIDESSRVGVGDAAPSSSNSSAASNTPATSSSPSPSPSPLEPSSAIAP
ncbi:MAG: polysaccharide biosynthesis/export family protein [Verrucomicrobiae bacterium]|nr:polysaccharide biosynthesis/export family protein [Verrucomicrobiae bacterium]